MKKRVGLFCILFTVILGFDTITTIRIQEIAQVMHLMDGISTKETLRSQSVSPKLYKRFCQYEKKSEFSRYEYLCAYFFSGKEAKNALDAIKSGSHVQVVGTASPEGSKEINDKLSQARADSVAEYLKSRGVTVDEATGKGVQGTTSNRLAVVYVK